MKINDTIRARRQALGLTQDGLAERLGVSAPAVSKWEKGLNYPDITLLPALARTLGVDMNTLLSFQEDMSDEDIRVLQMAAFGVGTLEGCEAAYQMFQAKLREFPYNDRLALSMPGSLKAVAMAYPGEGWEEKWADEFSALYERLTASRDPYVREQSLLALAEDCISRGDLDRAEELLDAVPDSGAGKKKMELQAALYEERGDTEQAKAIYVTLLLSSNCTVAGYLDNLFRIARKTGDLPYAAICADARCTVGTALGFCDSARFDPLILLARSQGDIPRALELLEKKLEALAYGARPPLYRLPPYAADAEELQWEQLENFFQRIGRDPAASVFTGDEPGYRELLDRYRTLLASRPVDGAPDSGGPGQVRMGYEEYKELWDSCKERRDSQRG